MVFGLDLVINPAGQWMWKDVTDLHHQRIEGRIDVQTVIDVLASAAKVELAIGANTRWWSPWGEWASSPSLTNQPFAPIG